MRPSRSLLRPPLVALLLLAGALPPGGCGYRFVRYEGALGELRSVAVRTPRNDSYEPGVEYTVADALRQEGLRRGALAMVDDPGAADLVLSGEVLPIRTVSRSVSSVELVLEYELTLHIALEARLRDGRELSFDPLALSESERYLASADVEATRKNREEALRRLAGVLAVRVYDSLYQELSP